MCQPMASRLAMQARLLCLSTTVLALALALASALLQPDRADAPVGPTSLAATTSDLPENRDTQLYRAIAARVAAGENYYEVAAELHRERSYPLFPFFTVRLPTLAHVNAAIGSSGLFVAAWLLLLGAILVWFRALADHGLVTRTLAVALLALGGAATITPAAIVLHEFWCGLLLTIAMGFGRRKEWPLQVAFAAAAVFVREFAVLFLLAMGFLALIERRWREVAAIAGVIGLFAAFLALHYLAVVEVRLPADLQSPPWTGLRGPTALVQDLARVSWLGLLPVPLAALLTFLPLAGWSSLARPMLTILWFAGFGAVIALFARPNNEYWILTMLPAYLVGLAMLGSTWRCIVQTGISRGRAGSAAAFDSIQS